MLLCTNHIEMWIGESQRGASCQIWFHLAWCHVECTCEQASNIIIFFNHSSSVQSAMLNAVESV